MLPRCSFIKLADETHTHRAVGTDGFEPLQCGWVGVDTILQPRPDETNLARINENGRYACIDHRRL